jgi:hypothetical protein
VKRFIALLIFFTPFNAVVCGQANEKYISKEINNIEKSIKKGTFIDGFIYLGSDTIATKILSFHGRKKTNRFLFCVSKGSGDSIKIFKPNEIKGYRIGNNNYLSHCSHVANFFLKQTKQGKVDLFERDPIPSDHRFLYYLNFKNSTDYFIINPLENNITIYDSPNSTLGGFLSPNMLSFNSKGINEKFKIFIAQHFNDCIKVVNMVKNDFYTIDDIPMIVEMYNNCGQ